MVSVIVAVICIFFIAAPAHADAAKELVNWIIAIFTKILVYIMELLSYILLFLLDYLIQIVQFNTFVNAAPVRIGWPLIRDTVNMFFIVVVLVSAFATIIGQPKEFHYRGILPKLLVMAVLINFSKTLIGLMIDFSQVLVLTFVNGFKDAAGGNFINALHIREVMSIETLHGSVIQQDAVSGNITIDANTAQQASIYQIFNMMLAAIFGIWILSLSITLVIIMLVFFLVRIIILWFLLITSPVMFFAWALPTKMQKSFSAFTDQWWQRLSTALIGGPTMAFFLWLALAMAQTQGGSDSLTGAGASSLYKNTSQEVKSNIEGLQQQSDYGNRIVSTEIGNPMNLANFIIMVAFMLLGVQVAVQQSNALAPKLGALAGAIGSTGGAMGIGVAGTVAAGRLLEKGVRGGVTRAGGAIEERYGVKAGLSKWALKSGIPMTQGARMALGRAATAPQRASVKRASEQKEAFANLPPDMYMKEMDRIKSSKLSTQPDKIAAMQNIAHQAMSSTYMKFRQGQEKEDILREKHGGAEYDSLNAEQKLAVDSEARQRVDSEVGGRLQEADEFATKNNMTELMDKVKEAREKNPGLHSKIDKIDSVANKMASDPESERKLQDDSFMNMAFTLKYLKGRNLMDENGNLTVDPAYDKDFQKLLRGRQGQLIASTLDFIQNSDDGRQRARTILTGTDNEVREAANVQINSSNDGRNYAVAMQATDTEPARVQGYTMGGFASDPAQIMAGVGQARVQGLTAALQSYGGRNIASVGRRLGSDARADELTTRLNRINVMPQDAARIQMGEILQKGLMDTRGLFGVDANGAFANTGNITAAQNAGNYQGVVRNAYENIRTGQNSEVNMRVIANSLSNAGGEALARHGAALRSLPQNQGYEALRKAMDQAGGDQARQFREGLKEVMNQAAVSMREQAAGNNITPVQQQQIATAEWLKGSQATSNEDKATVRRIKSFLHGSDTVSVT
ncbi:MAG: hypothetical protein WC750_03745 [Patescibacteria group bacterium]|jgi:hypothetical protein